MIDRKKNARSQEIALWAGRISALDALKSLSIPNYKDLPLIIVVTGVDNPLTPDVNEAKFGTGQDDPSTPGIDESRIGVGAYPTDNPATPIDESLMFTVAQARAYWYNDDDPQGIQHYATKMGRFDRINRENIPYWEEVLNNPLLTSPQKALIQRMIDSLRAEANYGLTYAIPEINKDEAFQTQNPPSETLSEVRDRKIAARNAEKALFQARERYP